jgi:hypothetical protein
MTQKDYILRVAEDVGRALAQIIYHKEIHDYQGALSLSSEREGGGRPWQGVGETLSPVSGEVVLNGIAGGRTA